MLMSEFGPMLTSPSIRAVVLTHFTPVDRM